MEILIGKGGEVQVIPVFQDDKEVYKGQELYNYLKEKELFKGSVGETYPDISPKAENVVFLGLGEKDKLNVEHLRKAFYNVAKILNKFKIESAGVKLEKLNDICYSELSLAISEGLLQSEYIFEKYLSEKKTKLTLDKFYLDVLEDEIEKVKDSINEAKNIIEGIFLARDLVNEPAITITPKELANVTKKELETIGVEVEVLGRDEIEELDMKAFLSVAKGSANEPQFIIMKWNGDKDSDEKLALVGKGLTYDSGGYSLKPTSGMVDMKTDMAGSASVIGAMKTIALSNVKKNVIGVVAACENLISGEAYKPGDVIGSMSGKTIEVLNTDAEGRITLADSLYYAATVVKADKIVDVATLTGGCVVAFGDVNTGAVTNNQELMDTLIEASKLAGEPMWQLPTNDEYKEALKGTIGDIKNSTGRAASALSAGLFLGEFVNNAPWVHLDIAGTAYIGKGRGYLPKGATGVPVKTLYNLAKM